MELRRIRSGTITELESKAYNIGVGISLGNKWFTTENIVELITWSLERTRKEVIVYVADSIHAINLQVRKRISKEKALQLALASGQECLQDIKDYIDINFSAADRERIVYAQWSDLADERYQHKVARLYTLFDNNPVFAEKVRTIVRNWTVKETRKFTDSDIDLFSTYILEELPECLLRVPIKGFKCDAYAYPFDGELPEFIEKIQSGEMFPEVLDLIQDTEPKVFLEVR